MKVILDTNFLINSVKYKARIFEQLKGEKVFVIKEVVDELKKMSKGKSKHASCAKIALKLIESEKIKFLKTKNYISAASPQYAKISTDSVLVNFSKKGYIILTQDKKLKERLKGKYGFLRERKIVII